MRDGIDAVDEQEGGAPTPGLVIAATDRRVAEWTALVEVAERDRAVDDAATDDREMQVRGRVGLRERDVRWRLG